MYDAGDGFRTIGSGHVIFPSENIPDRISKEYADELFQKDISLKRSESLDDFIKQYSIKLTQNQYDALLSFRFNEGGYKWDEDPKDFKLKSLLINGHYIKEEIAEAMLRYDLVGDKKNAVYIEDEWIKSKYLMKAIIKGKIGVCQQNINK